jgi:hypothetical protein
VTKIIYAAVDVLPNSCNECPFKSIRYGTDFYCPLLSNFTEIANPINVAYIDQYVEKFYGEFIEERHPHCPLELDEMKDDNIT